MTNKWIMIAAAVLAGAGVALGAYGAHGLEDKLRHLGHEATLAKRLAWFETGVRYQMYHALGLFCLACAPTSQTGSLQRASAALFVAGVLLFSGSLYVMTFAGEAWRKLGAVTPLGGLALILGWLLVAASAWRR